MQQNTSREARCVLLRRCICLSPLRKVSSCVSHIVAADQPNCCLKRVSSNLPLCAKKAKESRPLALSTRNVRTFKRANLLTPSCVILYGRVPEGDGEGRRVLAKDPQLHCRSIRT